MSGMDMIPRKEEFKRSEVEKLTNLTGKVLDYWETKFSVFSPFYKEGEKFYLYKDVKIILKLKRFLTIERLDDEEIKKRLKTDEISDRIKTKENTNQENKKIQPIKRENRIRETVNKTFINNNNSTGYEKKLKAMKEELLKILTILENNDKNKR